MAERPVYILKTGGTVFGVHRAEHPAEHRAEHHEHTTSTHIIGFRRRMYADVLAESLESYRARTGVFPPRDDDVGGLDCLADIGDIGDIADAVDTVVDANGVDAASLVEVEEISVAKLLARLEGTGMTLTVVYEDAAGELAWVDVRPRNDSPVIMAKLLQCLAREDTTQNANATTTKNNAVPAPRSNDVPPLLPKPVRKIPKNEFAIYSAAAETHVALNVAKVPPAMAPGLMWVAAWLAADNIGGRRRGSKRGIVARLIAGVLKWML